MTADYQALRAASPLPRGKPASPFAVARKKEQVSRSSTARGRVFTALARLHPRDYRDLYTAALAEVNAERGPLPGDETDDSDEVGA